MVTVAAAVAVWIAHTSALQPQGDRGLDTSGPIPYFIADGTGRTGYRANDRQLATWALETWQRHAGGSLRLSPGPESSALVRVYWADPTEGQYGEMRPLIVGGRRGAAVYIRPDMESLGADIARLTRMDALLRDAIVYLTCVHELGHALGLPHTDDFRDIMYYFGFGGDIAEYFDRYRRQLRTRTDIPRLSGLSDGDIKRLRLLYGAP
jgi:hypothetical protein